MKIILFILTFSIIISCNNGKPIPTIQSNGLIVIIDSNTATGKLRDYNSNDRYGYYPIYYIGKPTDTIYLEKEKIPGTRIGQKDYSNNKNFTWADSNKMKIVVDTTFSLTNTVYYKHYSEIQNNRIVDSIKSYKAYAIFVTNLSDSLLSLGSFSELGYTIRQAKNDKGVWVDIETINQDYCATGSRDIVLESKELLVAMLPRYKGDLKTQCRLKFTKWNHTVYSNIFTDYIDRKQLTDPLKNN